MRVLGFFFLSLASAADFSDVRAAFSRDQALRKEYTGTVRARLTVYSPGGGSETFPEMVRRIRGIEGGVCSQSAVWADGKSVYEHEEVSKRCADLTTEFSGIDLEQVLALSGYAAQAGSNAKKTIYLRAGNSGTTCLDSTDVRVEVEHGEPHPSMLRISGGPACAANRRGLFHADSMVEAHYAPIEGVWQLTSLVERHRAPFESHDVMTEVEFFFRTFKAKGRLREPMIRIEKTFSEYRRIDRARKLVANPVEGELKENSESSIRYDLETGKTPEKKPKE